jgi:hypothetical protein
MNQEIRKRGKALRARNWKLEAMDGRRRKSRFLEFWKTLP